MADEQLKYTLEFLAKLNGLKDAATATEDLADGIEDTRTAGQKLADSLDASHAAIRADLERTQETVDRLAMAMGPELAAKADPAELVADFRRLGLTLEDIDADVDRLAGSVGKLDTVSSGVGRIADNSDRARSNLANFAGNAASELPGVTGALGPLNVGIGQMVEGLAEGAVNWKQMAVAGGAMLAGSLILSGILKTSKQIDQVAVWETDTVEEWTKAIREGGSAIEELRNKATETGQIMGEIWGPTGGALADITPILDTAGITFDQFMEAVNNGTRGQAAMSAALQATGTDWLGQKVILDAVIRYQDMAGTAADKAAQFQRVFGDSLDDTGDAAAGATDKVAKYTTGVGGATVQTDKARIAAEKLQGLFDEMDAEDAALHMAQQFDDLRAAATEAYLAADEGADKAEQANRDYLLSQNETNRALYDYLVTVKGIPAERATAIMAMVDAGSIDAAERAIAKLTLPRSLLIQPRIGDPVGGVVVTPGQPARDESVGGGRGNPAGAAPVVNLTVNVTAVAPSAEVGAAVAESVQALFNDGGRWPWMGGAA